MSDTTSEDEPTMEEILASIRGTFKDPGVVTTRENIFEWTSQSETDKAQVTAHVMNGRTTIRTRSESIELKIS